MSTIIRGDTKFFLVRIRRTSGAAINIAGWSLSLTIKQSLDDEDDDAIFTLDVTDHSDPAGGESLLVIPAAVTEGFAAGQRYYCDVQLVTPSGVVLSIPQSTIVVAPDVTRRST